MMSSWKVKLLVSMPKQMRVSIVRKAINYYFKKYVDLNVTGEDNIDKVKGPIIFICNHLSNADGLILDKVLKKSDPYFVAGVKLTQDSVTNFGIEVVKNVKIRPNTADKEAITNMVNIVKSGENLMVFPEGTRSRTGSMIEGKRGILLVVRLTNATVIPIGMTGTEKVLPISKDGNMASEEWNKGTVNVNIGEGVKLPKRESGENKHEYEERCMNFLMNSIAKLLPEEYRGVYK